MKKIMLTIPICVGIIASTSMAIGAIGLPDAKVKDKSLSSWMSQVDDLSRLEDLAIPGSHDSFARYSMGDLAGKCQDLRLKTQLNIGVRFLDVRLKQNGEDFKVVHGPVDERMKFSKVLSTCYSFLDQHPSETILMSVKEEAEGKSKLSFSDEVNKIINKKYFYTDESLPLNIGQVRGKIVLISRYKNSTLGVPAYDGWLDSTSFEIASSRLYVQDQYKVENIEEKKQSILECNLKVSPFLKLNFLSGYYTNKFPPSYSVGVAKEINKDFKDSYSKLYKGVFIADFISEELSSIIVGGNL